MKENTKYHNYRFLGKIQVDEIQPWFDFASAKPWDESETPWVLDNRVRREILISLAEGAKTFEELYSVINFSPKPLIISKDEYECKVEYQWTKETLENHLLSLEWYNLIKKDNGRYELAFPILKYHEIQQIENFTVKFAENWLKVITEAKTEITKNFEALGDKTFIYEFLVEKSVEKLYELLKDADFLPDKSNLQITWAEQLREIKFEEWVQKIFNN